MIDDIKAMSGIFDETANLPLEDKIKTINWMKMKYKITERDFALFLACSWSVHHEFVDQIEKMLFPEPKGDVNVH